MWSLVAIAASCTSFAPLGALKGGTDYGYPAPTQQYSERPRFTPPPTRESLKATLQAARAHTRALATRLAGAILEPASLSDSGPARLNLNFGASLRLPEPGRKSSRQQHSHRAREAAPEPRQPSWQQASDPMAYGAAPPPADPTSYQTQPVELVSSRVAVPTRPAPTRVRTERDARWEAACQVSAAPTKGGAQPGPPTAAPSRWEAVCQTAPPPRAMALGSGDEAASVRTARSAAWHAQFEADKAVERARQVQPPLPIGPSAHRAAEARHSLCPHPRLSPPSLGRNSSLPPLL